jgi:hypothetical protein
MDDMKVLKILVAIFLSLITIINISLYFYTMVVISDINKEVELIDTKTKFTMIMKTYNISYCDAGCELGWELATTTTNTKFTLEYALELVEEDSLFLRDYYNYFKNDKN